MRDKLEYQEMIIDFNSDKDIIALREKYKEPTFFEVISKQRSETTYSSFLKWMFQSSSTNLGTVSPLLLLLDVLVARSHDNQITDDIKTHIITRNFKFNDIQVETEKSVSLLATEIGVAESNSCVGLTQDEIRKIVAKCEDRIDLYIECSIEINIGQNHSKKLRIVLENKIDSGQGSSKCVGKIGVPDKYENCNQTTRYYNATAINDEDNIQVYVYLAPAATHDKEITKEGKVHEKYVKIDYQDVVDGIIIPLLASSTLTPKQRFILEEAKAELTFPSLEGGRVRNSIANSKESIKLFEKIWNGNPRGYRKLILDAAITALESFIWYAEATDTYYDSRAKDYEIIKWCLENHHDDTLKQRWINCGNNEVIFNDKIIRFKHSSNIIKYSNTKGLGAKIVQFAEDNEVSIMLKSFWNNNQKFLLAIMSGMKEVLVGREREVIEKLLNDSSKRDTTKYRVYYNDKCLNDDWLGQKAANNGETAWLIVKAWLEKKKETEFVDINWLNKQLTPNKCNSYYSNGKWLKKLFYPYSEDGKYIVDGTENEGGTVDAGGWDFYKPKNHDDLKFQLKLNDGTKVIMLKMWRKDDLRKLYNHVKGEGIDVQPAP